MKYEVVNAGPYLGFDDLAPHVTKYVADSIMSIIPGRVGPLRFLDNKRRIIIKSGTRSMSIDFTRGEEVMIVRHVKTKKLLIVTKKHYDSYIEQLTKPIFGSGENPLVTY